jgi:signal transduction histidine kinase
MAQMKNDELIVFATAFILLFLLSGLFVVLVFRYKNRISQNQLESFNAILEAHESEQERIAKDLHDQINPTLSIIKAQIECINTEKPDETDIQIKSDVIEQLQHAINDVRNIAHNLIPSSFNQDGFIKSVEYYILRIKEYNKINTVFSTSEWNTKIGKNNEISIYRIIQELFQNTIKHAHASLAELKINCDEKSVNIYYFDNGIGFDTNTIKKGIGLNNIESRVKLLGGNTTIYSNINEGVSIKIELHIKNLFYER